MNRYRQYEHEKKKLKEMRLSPKEYERVIIKIVKRLGL